MSWTAHDFGPYAVQGRLAGRVALLPLYIGSLGPDLFTKWSVYGVDFLGIDLGAANAPAFHRSWPGAGFTHAPFFALLVVLAVYAVFRNRIWAVSLGLGLLLHCLTGNLDSFGTMLLFPFTTEQFPVGLWAYSVGQGSRYDDGTAYFSSRGLIVDLAFLSLALVNFRVLKRAYFESKVLPLDPVMAGPGGTCR